MMINNTNMQWKVFLDVGCQSKKSVNIYEAFLAKGKQIAATKCILSTWNLGLDMSWSIVPDLPDNSRNLDASITG